MSEEKTEEIEMEEAKELPLVEEGDYEAKISNIETDVEGRYGDMVRIKFDINGTEVPALASQNLNENTKLYGWVEILTGKKLKVGDKLKFSDLVGKKALVTVRNRQVKGKDGKLRTDDDGNEVMTSDVKEIRPAKK